MNANDLKRLIKIVEKKLKEVEKEMPNVWMEDMLQGRMRFGYVLNKWMFYRELLKELKEELKKLEKKGEVV